MALEMDLPASHSCSKTYIHKITNVPVFLDFFGSIWHSLRSLPFQSPKMSRISEPTPFSWLSKWICTHQNHYVRSLPFQGPESGPQNGFACIKIITFNHCHFRAPKSLDFQGPPLPMALVMDLPASKPFKQQLHFSRSRRSLPQKKKNFHDAQDTNRLQVGALNIYVPLLANTGEASTCHIEYHLSTTTHSAMFWAQGQLNCMNMLLNKKCLNTPGGLVHGKPPK
jgi:hypothetical protein